MTSITCSAITTWLDALKNQTVYFLEGDGPSKIEYEFTALVDPLSCGTLRVQDNLKYMNNGEFTKYSGVITFFLSPLFSNSSFRDQERSLLPSLRERHH